MLGLFLIFREFQFLDPSAGVLLSPYLTIEGNLISGVSFHALHVKSPDRKNEETIPALYHLYQRMGCFVLLMLSLVCVPYQTWKIPFSSFLPRFFSSSFPENGIQQKHLCRSRCYLSVNGFEFVNQEKYFVLPTPDFDMFLKSF